MKAPAKLSEALSVRQLATEKQKAEQRLKAVNEAIDKLFAEIRERLEIPRDVEVNVSGSDISWEPPAPKLVD